MKYISVGSEESGSCRESIVHKHLARWNDEGVIEYVLDRFGLHSCNRSGEMVFASRVYQRSTSQSTWADICPSGMVFDHTKISGGSKLLIPKTSEVICRSASSWSWTESLLLAGTHQEILVQGEGFFSLYEWLSGNPFHDSKYDLFEKIVRSPEEFESEVPLPQSHFLVVV